MKLNEIAKSFDKDGDKKPSDMYLQIQQLKQMMAVRATKHPGSKRGYIHPARGRGNTARAVTRTRRAAPWAFRSNRIRHRAGLPRL